MKSLTVFSILVFLVAQLSSVIVPWALLSPSQQAVSIPDAAGMVLCTEQFLANTNMTPPERVLPELRDGWPQTYTSSNTFKGAIYTNMDDDEEMEIIFGVGTKIVAHNLDGTPVTGWLQQLNYYVWGSPACGDITGDGEDEIIACSRNNTTGNIGELYAFHKTGEPVDGFPVTMAGGGTMNACLADIDDDGDLEIFVNVRNHPNGWTYVFDGDGSVFPGWPQQLDTFPGASVSVGDITGDDIPEIISLSYNSLFAFDIAGNILDGFPVSYPGYNYSYSQPILADIDGDGLREIIYGGCSAGGAVFVVKSDGSFAQNWPQTVDNWIFATPALADLDGDGNLDIVIGDQISSGTPIDHIYAWHADGTPLDGFPAGPTNAIYAQTGIADLDGDGLPEIMIDDNVFANGYEAYNHDGSHCSDWPLTCGTGWDSITMQMTPVFGDFDNDGFLEIAGAATGFTSYIVECCLWDTDSPWLENLAFMAIDGCNIRHDGLYPQTLNTHQSPTQCSADIFDYNDVHITWTMDDAGQDGFYLYGNGSIIAQLADPALREYDRLALNNGVYEFYLTAYYENTESEPSPSAFVEINLLPPQNIIFDSAGGQVNIYWSAPAIRSLTAYNIYRDQILIATTADTMFTEYLPEENIYEYYLTAVYSDSIESEASQIFNVTVTDLYPEDIPDARLALNCFPNPFNPSTTISFHLDNAENITLSVYNCAGQLVRSFPQTSFPAGKSSVIWNGYDNTQNPAASGLYFIQLKNGKTDAFTKAILLK
jgi:hypothetical protein